MVNKLIIKKDNEQITLLDESDVLYELDKKLDKLDAFSKSYNDLTDKPNIPSDITDLGLETSTLTITHEDDTTEDITIVIIPNNNDEVDTS